ncbi:MAG: ABC transporter substrate-binding protein [Burkholderiales bacterium]
MAKPSITFASGLYDRMLPLYTGEVKADDIDLKFVAIDNPRIIFDRMAGEQAFDACEMSTSEYMARVSAGKSPFVAIPVFPSRVFRHSFITINKRSGIKTPQDLAGKRIGVPLYTMTAAVWIRGHLQHDYGVDLSKVTWVQGAIETGGAHGAPTVLPLLKPVRIEANTSGKSLNELLDEGSIDAVLGTAIPDSIKTNPDIVRLFPNFREIERDYYRRTRIFPIMHSVVIRRDVYEKNPFVAKSLFNVLNASKNAALVHMKYLGALRYMLPWLTSDIDEIDDVFGGDPWPYGLEANRPTLEALVQYLADQHIIAKPMPIESLFLSVE